MTFDATSFIEAILALIGVCITTFLIPYLKSKTNKETQDEINNWVRIAVTAAEQIYNGSGRGTEKKAYVVKWLIDHNITYDANKIDAMIEAAVYTLKQNGLITAEAVTNVEG